VIAGYYDGEWGIPEKVLKKRVMMRAEYDGVKKSPCNMFCMCLDWHPGIRPITRPLIEGVLNYPVTL
jgi:hypothetical protein